MKHQPKEIKVTETKNTIENAVELHKKGDIQAAETIFQQVLKDNPDNDIALYRMGIICLQTGRLQDAVSYLEKAASIDTLSSDILNNLGIAYYHMGRYDATEAVYKKSLTLHPDHALTLGNLATLMQAKGDWEEAERYFQLAICFKRDYSDAHNNLGNLYLDQGRLEEAMAKFYEALRHSPELPSAHNNLGRVYKEMGKKEEAEASFRKAIELDPNFADAYNNLGNILRSKMQLQEAQEVFQKALKINPTHEMALYNMMLMFEFSHKLDEASEILEKTKKINPNHPAIALITAKLALRKGNIDEGIKALEESHLGDNRWGMYSYFELGKLYDRKNEPQKAFDAFTKGNSLHAQSHEARYTDKKSYPGFIKETRKYFTKPNIEKWSPPAPENKDYPTPVFIIGFPRSGTTLLDQILSSHPAFQVVEEHPGIESVRSHLQRKYGNYTECLEGLSEDDINDLRRIFYETHAEYEKWDGKSIFVDKFPLNTVLTGIIHRLFPEAKIIFAQRHPCDCVLSCFMQQFTLNPGMIQFLDLENAAWFYTQVMDLWFQLQETLPLNSYTYRYESVVKDFEGSIASLLDFLEVPWDDKVLEYDKTAKKRAKTARTPSYSQVTEKIYTRARYRWERYKEQLAPVLPVLLPYAEKLGYGSSEQKEDLTEGQGQGQGQDQEQKQKA